MCRAHIRVSWRHKSQSLSHNLTAVGTVYERSIAFSIAGTNKLNSVPWTTTRQNAAPSTEPQNSKPRAGLAPGRCSWSIRPCLPKQSNVPHASLTTRNTGHGPWPAKALATLRHGTKDGCSTVEHTQARNPWQSRRNDTLAVLWCTHPLLWRTLLYSMRMHVHLPHWTNVLKGSMQLTQSPWTRTTRTQASTRSRGQPFSCTNPVSSQHSRATWIAPRATTPPQIALSSPNPRRY